MDGPLIVNAVYFYPIENAEAHHTDRYEAIHQPNPPASIVRRGQPFNAMVSFNRPYYEAYDRVQLMFALGDSPRLETLGSMFLRPDAVADKTVWSAVIKSTDVQMNNIIYFEVTAPASLPVGRWSVRVVTHIKQTRMRLVYNYPQHVIVLFNPWCPDDQVYMKDTSLLQEYVLNDVGKLWMGPDINSTTGTPWVYGQFDINILPASIYLLHRAMLPFNNRGDPVKVTRAISRIVNSDDDQGVLVGKWNGDYANGTSPFEWTGSVEILAQYLESEQPVKYGQCWVFAGIVTTVCRALGIPCRTISNLVSAHDANCTLSIDKYYNEFMREFENYDPNNDPGKHDSLWNFHLWNDVWMSRPDLPTGFGGWQAIDATPQERSLGFLQCGPAPLEAIKNGIIGVGYDVEFVLSSVNADLMRWREDPDSETGYSLVETVKNTIGHMILTKKPFVFDPTGDADREDITDQYKFKEGTDAERVALMRAVHHSERAKRFYLVANNTQNDVKFILKDVCSVSIGNDFTVSVDIQNTSNEVRNAKVALVVTSMFYNGVKSELLKTEEGNVFLAPQQKQQISILVTAYEYLPKLVEYSNVKISAMALVDETKQAWADDNLFQIIKPNILIKFNEDLIYGKPAVAMLSLPNPLNYPLTGCEFRVTSTGILGGTHRLNTYDVSASTLLTAQLTVEPNKLGKIHFVATFKSNELQNITGAATVEVSEA